MDVRDNLMVQSITGVAVREESGGQIVSQYPGTSTLNVAWMCTAPRVDSDSGSVEVLVEVPQPLSLIVNVMHDKLAHADTGLMAAGIPDRTTVTVRLEFGDDTLTTVTDESVFDGPRINNIWMPFDGTSQYNGTATLNVVYDYHGQNYTGQVSVLLVQVYSTFLSVIPFGFRDANLTTIRYISNCTNPEYQLVSVILSATLSDGSRVEIPEFDVSVDGDNCSTKPYAFTPCPSTISDETVMFTINTSFTSFTDSVTIKTGTSNDPVEITGINVMLSDGDDVTQKAASISLQLSDNTVIPNVYTYFSNSPSAFLEYSTDPIGDSVFSFDLDTGAITIHKDHYKLAEIIISPIDNPNNISGTGQFIANVDDGASILVGATIGIPIPPVSILDTFTVPIFYNVSIVATGFIARFQFSDHLLRAVSANLSFHRAVLTNFNAPPGQVTITGLVLGDELYNAQNGLRFDVEFEALGVGVSPIIVAIELLYNDYDFSSTNFGSSAVMVGRSEDYYDVMNTTVSVGELLFALNESITLCRDLVQSTADADINNDTITSVDDVVFGIKLVTGLAFYLSNISATPVQNSDNCTLLVKISYSGIGGVPPDPRTLYSFILLTNPDVELLSMSRPRLGGYVSQLDMAVLYEAGPDEGGFTLELVTPITILNDIGISVIQLVGDYSNRIDYDHLNVFILSINDKPSISVDVTSHRSPLIGLEGVRIGTMATGYEPLNFINNTHRSDYCYFDNTGVYVVELPENTTVDTIVYNVSAVEPGFPTNSEVYSLVPINSSGTFVLVDRVTGGIRLEQPLDSEETGYYFYTFTATYTLSNGSTVTIGPADIIIQVADINDNTPQIDATTINQTLAFDEDVAVNTSVITIIATDRDSGENGRLTYSITSGDNLGQFYIDPDNGELTIVEPLDRENIESYALKIQVSDNGVEPRITFTYVYIDLNDINDSPPLFDREVYNVSIDENSANGTMVPGLLLVADDPDVGGTFTFSLTNDTDFPFIFSQDGVFALNGEVDTELQEVYTTIAVATDDFNGMTSTALIVINIGDINDNAPVFNESLQNQYYYEIDAPLSEVGFVFATDSDKTTNQQIIYDLISVSMFGIDRDTGIISAAEPYDGTSNRLLTLTIIARDMGTPQLNDTTFVYITLIESQVVSFLPSNELFLLGYPNWVEDTVYDQQVGAPFVVDIGDTAMITTQFGQSLAEDFNDVFIRIIGDPAVKVEMLLLQEMVHYDLRTITVLIQAEDAQDTIPLPSVIVVTVVPSEELQAIQNVTKSGSCMTTEHHGFCVVQLVDFPLEWFNKEPDNVGDHVTVSASLLNDMGNVVATKEATLGVETHPIYNEAVIDSSARMLLIGPTHLSVSTEIYTMEIYIRVTDGAPDETIDGNMVLRHVSVIGRTTITEDNVAMISSGTAGDNWECSFGNTTVSCSAHNKTGYDPTGFSLMATLNFITPLPDNNGGTVHYFHLALEGTIFSDGTIFGIPPPPGDDLVTEFLSTQIDAISPGFYVATTERPDLADMRQITGEVSSVPIMIYTIDNNIPVNIIRDNTVVVKLSNDVPSLDLSCTSSTTSVTPSSRCEALTIPMNSTTSLPSRVTVRLTSSILGSESIPGLGSPITFYVWSSTDVTLFLSDYILSPVEDWYSNCAYNIPRYQPAEVSVWATFYNQIVQLSVTADVSSFVHNFTSSGTSVCTVEGRTVSAVGAGVAAISMNGPDGNSLRSRSIEVEADNTSIGILQFEAIVSFLQVLVQQASTMRFEPSVLRLQVIPGLFFKNSRVNITVTAVLNDGSRLLLTDPSEVNVVSLNESVLTVEGLTLIAQSPGSGELIQVEWVVCGETLATTTTEVIVAFNTDQPTFLNVTDVISIPENQHSGEVIYTVTAIDNDVTIDHSMHIHAEIEYTLQAGSDYDGLFSVDVTTGEILLTRPLDRETRDSYVIKVLATDAAQRMIIDQMEQVGCYSRFEFYINEFTLTVLVQDVNDNAPKCAPTSSILLDVSTAINTSVLWFRATDPDLNNNALLNYSLRGFEEESTFLRINSTTGDITTTENLLMFNMTWNLTVHISDTGNPPLSTECNILIQLCITAIPPTVTAPRSPDKCDDVPSWAIAMTTIQSIANLILIWLVIVLSILCWRYYVKLKLQIHPERFENYRNDSQNIELINVQPA